MIARPEHVVNAGLVVAAAELGAVDGVDLEATVERIEAWGGDAALYRHFLSRALDTAAPSATAARALATIAGWRSGVVALRDEALRRIAEVPADGAAAALGLEAPQLAAFVAEQASSPFAWPSADQLVARIGGFSGFGDAWVAQPTAARFVAAGAVEVTCGAERWMAQVDVFGARLTRSGEAASTASSVSSARALVSENSYLVEIVRGAA